MLWECLQTLVGILMATLQNAIDDRVRTKQDSTMTDTMKFAQDMSSREILDARSRGEAVFCRCCRTPIAIISADDESPPLKAAPGIYCIQDQDHFEVRFNIARPHDYWNKFSDRPRNTENE
jgi:hypothetical protein